MWYQALVLKEKNRKPKDSMFTTGLINLRKRVDAKI